MSRYIANPRAILPRPDLASPADQHRIQLRRDLLHALADALAKIARVLEAFHVHPCEQRPRFVGNPLEVRVICHVPEIERIEKVEQIRDGALMKANGLALVGGLQPLRQMLDELGQRSRMTRRASSAAFVSSLAALVRSSSEVPVRFRAVCPARRS